MRGRMDSSRLWNLPRLARRGLGIPSLALCAVLAGAGLPACTSGGTQSEGPAQKTGRPIELRYLAVAKNLSFGLVNESHTDRTDLYSTRQPLDSATTKVSPDEVVDAIVEYFRDQGFFAIAQAGRAPAKAPQGVSQMLEVVTPDGPYHAVLRPGVSAQHVTTFQTCAKALLDVYNSTMQLQAVDSAPAWSGSEPARRRDPSRSGG